MYVNKVCLNNIYLNITLLFLTGCLWVDGCYNGVLFRTHLQVSGYFY